MERRVEVKSIQIDRSKMLKDQPHTGHNRWHPDVEPKVEAEPGEEVVLETRDACDGQILFGDSIQAVSRIARGVVHPLTGPVYVKGAEPGDLLEIECLDVIPEAAGWTRISPGMGFLRDVFLGAVPGALGHQRWLGYLGNAPRRSDSIRGLHGHRGGRPITRAA